MHKSAQGKRACTQASSKPGSPPGSLSSLSRSSRATIAKLLNCLSLSFLNNKIEAVISSSQCYELGSNKATGTGSEVQSKHENFSVQVDK